VTWLSAAKPEHGSATIELRGDLLRAAARMMCDPLFMTPPTATSTLTLPSPVVDPTDAVEDMNGELLVEESLVEEVSIDGMCGVY
jgi:mycofactocin precursor